MNNKFKAGDKVRVIGETPVGTVQSSYGSGGAESVVVEYRHKSGAVTYGDYLAASVEAVEPEALPNPGSAGTPRPTSATSPPLRPLRPLREDSPSASPSPSTP